MPRINSTETEIITAFFLHFYISLNIFLFIFFSFVEHILSDNVFLFMLFVQIEKKKRYATVYCLSVIAFYDVLVICLNLYNDYKIYELFCTFFQILFFFVALLNDSTVVEFWIIRIIGNNWNRLDQSVE